MFLIRWILFPFTLLYTLIIWIRNKLYDIGIISSKQFQIKTIVIGNLAVGGAGKSPLVELLISHFKSKYKLATLSRGYGRKTSGFRYVNTDDHPSDVGDEPLQFKRKYPAITVSVDENRSEGIQKLQPAHELIILDDAFQHRKVKPICSILLFDYHSLLKSILLLPTGEFRDTFDQTKRADIILITKSPDSIDSSQRKRIERKIRKQNVNAPIFYAKISYLPIISINPGVPAAELSELNVLLLTGIANPKPLISYLNGVGVSFKHLAFADHHNFSSADYIKIRESYKSIDSENKVILTTEKDIQRIDTSQLPEIPVFYIPIKTEIEHQEAFFQQLEDLIY